MISGSDFLQICKKRDFTFFSGTPCSYLKPLINQVIDDPEIQFIDATNEGDAVAIASGAYVGGRKSVVMFQNSGLGNAVNALTSLNYPFKIPVLILVTHRGDPAAELTGEKDEPQHELMGKITESILDTLKIKWSHFPQDLSTLEKLFADIEGHFLSNGLPYALILKKDSILPYKLQNSNRGCRKISSNFTNSVHLPPTLFTRAEVLQAYVNSKNNNDLVIATTGFTGRELYTLQDHETHLYMVGSMGSASSFALGLSLVCPERKIFVFDGDGALLMRMGNLATIGAYAKDNFIHVLLDNEAHDSTGGQKTVSGSINFTQVANSCGYKTTIFAQDLNIFSRLQNDGQAEGPTFVHIKTSLGTLSALGRPQIGPQQVKERFMKNIFNFKKSQLNHGRNRQRDDKSPLETSLANL